MHPAHSHWPLLTTCFSCLLGWTTFSLYTELHFLNTTSSRQPFRELLVLFLHETHLFWVIIRFISSRCFLWVPSTWRNKKIISTSFWLKKCFFWRHVNLILITEYCSIFYFRGSNDEETQAEPMSPKINPDWNATTPLRNTPAVSR